MSTMTLAYLKRLPNNMTLMTPQMTEISNEVQYPKWALELAGVLALLIGVLGFFGNLLTILALRYSRRLRNAATWFVINLAFTEMIFCVTILPLTAAHMFYLAINDKGGLFSDVPCKFYVFIRYVIIQAELFSIAAIAVNRCVLISTPKKYAEIYTKKRTIGFVLAIWFIALLLMLLPLTSLFGSFEYNVMTQECDFSDKGDYKDVPRKVFLLGGFVIPSIIIIGSYTYIFRKATQSSLKMTLNQDKGIVDPSSNQPSGTTQSTSRPASGLTARDIRIARTIGVIFIVFLLCCTPVTVAHYVYSEKVTNPTLLLLLHPVYWLQYCLNIFIYGFMNKQYRDAYINYISSWFPGFRELTRDKFRWAEEEATSDRHSRHGTPNSVFRSSLRVKNQTNKKQQNVLVKFTKVSKKIPPSGPKDQPKLASKESSLSPEEQT